MLLLLATVTQMFLLVDPFWLQKITTHPDILAHSDIECLDYRYPEFKICISELILDRYQYMRVTYIKMHCII
jgi:hypothetical protein